MKTYPLFKAHLPIDAILCNVEDVLSSGFINEGEAVAKFTTSMSKELNSTNFIAVNSCTSAITLALRLAGVNLGGHVMSTPMTCVASNTPVYSSGSAICWADVDPETGMVTIATLEAAYHQWVKALIIVAWAGSPPELDAIASWCHEKGVKLILDAAHAFGATYKGRPIHEFADFCTYSFQAIKHITTGDGGGLVCKSDEDYQRSKAMKWFGLDRDMAKDEKGNWKGQQWDVDITESGYKFNMNNLAASIGLAQLPHIAKILTTHRRNAATYDEDLKLNPCLARPTNKYGIAGEGSSWVYTMLLDASLDRDDVLRKLNARGVMAGVVHVPNHRYTVFTDCYRELPGADKFAAHQFSLPCGWWLNDDDIKEILSILKEVLDECADHP